MGFHFLLRRSTVFAAFVLTATMNMHLAHAQILPDCEIQKIEAILLENPAQQNSRSSLDADSVGYRQKTQEILHRQINDFGQFAQLNYGPAASEVFHKLMGLGREFLPLMAEPGIVLRLNAFVEFARPRIAEGIHRDEIVRQFSSHLGVTRVYRALYLTPEQAEAIRVRGMTPRSFVNSTPEMTADLISSRGYIQLLEDRKSGKNIESSPFLSMTSHREVAIAVALDFAAPGLKLYVFTLDLPQLSLVDFSPYSRFIPRKDSGFHDADEIAVIFKNGKRKYFDNDSRLESFVLGKIEPSEIVEVDEVTTPLIRSYEFIDPQAGRPIIGPLMDRLKALFLR